MVSHTLKLLDSIIASKESATPGDAVAIWLTRFGLLVPVLYFGMQLAAAPFYPGYSFISNVASELGSDKAQYASIFNIGIMATGACAILAAIGFALTLWRLNRPLIGTLLPAALLLNGIQ